VLVLARRAQWNAVWLFWTRDWQHLRWYVNLEQPICIDARGVQVRDCALDIVVHPHRRWTWKDRDEFEALRDRGFFTSEVAARVEAEARRMVSVIERWEAPFCDGWESWRPDPSPPAPVLPADWRDLSPAASGARP
jgi:protein associated with RNAse G/E